MVLIGEPLPYLVQTVTSKKSHSDSYGYAEISGDEILYMGNSIGSPSKFARKVKKNTNVNAWINLELKRPQDRTWKLANSLGERHIAVCSLNCLLYISPIH